MTPQSKRPEVASNTLARDAWKNWELAEAAVTDPEAGAAVRERYFRPGSKANRDRALLRGPETAKPQAAPAAGEPQPLAEDPDALVAQFRTLTPEARELFSDGIVRAQVDAGDLDHLASVDDDANDEWSGWGEE